MSGDSTNITGSNIIGNFVQGNVKARVTGVNIGDSNSPSNSNHHIVELLSQLRASVENDKDLKQLHRNDALEEVKALEEAAKNPDKNITTAQRSVRTLRGIMSELPTATNFVTACSQLLPLISKAFGL
jgi:hypothetical protein